MNEVAALIIGLCAGFAGGVFMLFCALDSMNERPINKTTVIECIKLLPEGAVRGRYTNCLDAAMMDENK